MSGVGSRGQVVRLISVLVLMLVACSSDKSAVRTHFVCRVSVGGSKRSLSVNLAHATSAQTALVGGSPLRGYTSSVSYLVKFSVQGTPKHRLARIAVAVDGGTDYGTRAFDEGSFPFVGTVRVLVQWAVGVAYDCPLPT